MKFRQIKIFHVVTSLLVLFSATCLIYVMVPYPEHPGSPDEVANLFFSNTLANNEYLAVSLPDYVPKNLQDFFHPRSINVNDSGSLIPASFLGFPVINAFFIRFLPLQAIFSLFLLLLIFLLLLLYKKATSGAHFIAFFLLTISNPLILYYSFRGLFPNVLFCLLFLASLLFLFQSGYDKKHWFFLSSITLALAGWVRMNELVWALPLFLILLIFLFYKKGSRKLLPAIVIWLVIFLVVLGVAVMFSYSLNNSFTQYRTVNLETITEPGSNILQTLKFFILPYGFDITTSFKAFFQYSLYLWWWTIPLLFIFLYFFILSIIHKQKKAYLLFFILLIFSIYIIFYYGTYPQDSKNDVIISYSHYRYWLPLFIFFPFILSRIPQKKILNYYVLYGAVVVGLVSILFTFYSKSGIQDNYEQNRIVKNRIDVLKTLIPENALIIAGKGDKYFFPNWLAVSGTIIDPYREKFANTLIGTQINEPVYYYYIEAEISSRWTKQAFQNSGIEFVEIMHFYDGGNAWEYLYKLDWPNKEKNGNE